MAMTVKREAQMTSPILVNKGFAPQAIAIFSYAILLAGIITIGFSAYMVVVSYSSLPFWDGWVHVAFVARGGNPYTLAWLWSQHNEHRMLIPRLFWLADLRWFHARQVFLLASIFLIQFLHLLLLGWSMRVFGGWRGAVWRSGVGLAAFCLFCPSQWEVLVWGECIGFVLSGLFVTASFIGLLLYWMGLEEQSKARHAWKFLLLSIVAASAATCSLANGNLLWPLLVAATLFLRLRFSAILSFVVAGTVSLAIYFHHYSRPSQQANPILSIQSPVKLFEFLGAYFGSSSGVRSNFHMAELIGVAGLTVFLVLLLHLLSYIRDRRPFCVQLVLIVLFCLGTALVTAAGRLNFGTRQAFASRYQTVSLLFWCCLGLLLLEAVCSLRQMRNVAFLLSQVILLAAMLVGLGLARIPLTNARLHGFQLNAAAMALVTNVPDSAQLQWVYPDPGYLFPLVPYMREEHLSVFSERLSSLLGKPLDSVFILASPSECTGKLESSDAVAGEGPPALRITGWAWDYKHRQPPSMIVAATDGIITGLGAVGDWRPLKQAASPGMTSNFIGYTGYVRDAWEPGSVKIYAILRGSPASACLIARQSEAPSEQRRGRG
jgi:hypothetical protein